jgi:hypothetical protein
MRVSCLRGSCLSNVARAEAQNVPVSPEHPAHRSGKQLKLQFLAQGNHLFLIDSLIFYIHRYSCGINWRKERNEVFL